MTADARSEPNGAAAPWYEQDAFWRDAYPILFGMERWARTPQAVDDLLALATPPPSARILDLCCGPGRHALELARRGYHVTGVDRTAAYLKDAEARAASEGLPIEFVLEDMRRFRRPAAFDLAVNLFTSFGYFEDPSDDLRTLENIYASLRPGGRLVMDLVGKEIIARNFRERDWGWIDPGSGIRMLEERKLSMDWGWIESTWILQTPAGERTMVFSHRLYAGTELRDLLRRAGFGTVALHGSLKGTAYDLDAARLIAIATKLGDGVP